MTPPDPTDPAPDPMFCDEDYDCPPCPRPAPSESIADKVIVGVLVTLLCALAREGAQALREYVGREHRDRLRDRERRDETPRKPRSPK
jgi:hypothetical protein